jgi:hypothetical protein
MSSAAPAVPAPPSAAELLATWELGQGQPPPGRALTMLRLVDERGARDADGLTLGEADRRLLALREALFGRKFSALCACPRCRESIELSFDSGDLPRHAENPAEALSLRIEGLSIGVREPTVSDFAAAWRAEDAASARAILVERCIVARNGSGVTIPAAALPARAAEAASAALERAEPLSCAQLSVCCPECGHEWNSAFDVAVFLWTELDAWARSTLREVHVLARAYGWTEPEVL